MKGAIPCGCNSMFTEQKILNLFTIQFYLQVTYKEDIRINLEDLKEDYIHLSIKL